MFNYRSLLCHHINVLRQQTRQSANQVLHFTIKQTQIHRIQVI